MKSYFDYHLKGFNPYQVLTVHPTELSIFGSHTFHELMIEDRVRISAYQQAIKSVGKNYPRATWVDVGTGLGPLALMAAALAVPKKVYAIEQVASTFALAKNIVESQSTLLRNKIALIHGRSFDVELPEKADVLVTETIGNFGLEEGIIALLNDAKKRYLKKDAIIIPSEIEFMVAPIESLRCVQRIHFWKNKKLGLDFSVMLPHAAKTVYHHRVLPNELLAKPLKCGSIQFMTSDEIQEKIALHGTHVIQRSGMLHGFVGWFRARLYDNVFLSNDPLKKRTPFSWTQVFFPIAGIDKKNIRVKRNQKINFSIRWDLANNDLVWEHVIL